MERELFFALGLHLWTEWQLYWLICFIGHIELIIMWIIMWIKNFFVEKLDLVYLILSIQMIVYVMFLIEHLTFFSCIFYVNIFLLIIYLICRKYKKTW